jgi:hypothetical protein
MAHRFFRNVGCALRTNKLDLVPKLYLGTPLAAKLRVATGEAKLGNQEEASSFL